jgi:hypothetical protein
MTGTNNTCRLKNFVRLAFSRVGSLFRRYDSMIYNFRRYDSMIYNYRRYESMIYNFRRYDSMISNFVLKTLWMPWRRGAVDIASAPGVEDPGSNPARE